MFFVFKVLKLRFLENAELKTHSNFTLSISVSSIQSNIDESYQIQAINELVDFVHLVAYEVNKLL